MSDHETTLRAIAQHGTTGTIYEPSPEERAACLAGAAALRSRPPDDLVALVQRLQGAERAHEVRRTAATERYYLDALAAVQDWRPAVEDEASRESPARMVARPCPGRRGS